MCEVNLPFALLKYTGTISYTVEYLKLATEMYCIVQLYILTQLLFLWVCSADSQSNTVVYVATNGTNDENCLTGGPSKPCKNLTLAIEYIHTTSSVTLYIKSGQYELLPSSGMTFNNGENITMEKDGEGVVEISCKGSGTGLTFIDSKSITIRGLVFNGCGAEHYSTSHDFNNETDGINFLTFNATLYFQGCTLITLDSITIKNSLGIAVQIYYTLGINYIINSDFIDNPGNQEIERGGGVYIEFPYCFPGNRLCTNTVPQVPMSYVTDSQYIITSCRFISNIAHSTTSSIRFVLPYKYYHISFGHGGGLSVFFKGHAKNNYILLQDCSFLDNTAVYGGGLYVEMQDHSNDNAVVLMGSNVFTSNKAKKSGGGAFLAYLFTEQFGNVTSGTLTLNDVFFENNKAIFGGGVSFLSTRRSHICENNFNEIIFTNCIWSNNIAWYGSALDISCFHPVSEGIIHEVIMKNCSFIENSVIYNHSPGKPLGSGAMYVDKVPITFKKSVEFINNYDGTALFAMGSKLEFSSNTNVLFLNNTGRNGGAIALYSSSYIKVHGKTSFEFIENTAVNLGGAIYTDYIGSHLQKTSLNCFIQYFDITKNPSNWSTLFQFTNNTANKKPNSIYATSINGCLLGRAYGILNKNLINEVFCWNNATDIWIYNSSVTYEACSDQILTDATFLNRTILQNITVVPGRQQQMGIVAIDEQGKDVTSNLVLHAYGSHGTSVDERYNYISTDDIILLKTSTLDNVTITFDTTSQNTLRTKIAVHFQDCPPGLELMEGKCNCRGDFNKHLLCDPFHLNASLLRGYWIGKSPYNNTTTVVAHCRNCEYGKEGGHFSLGDNLQLVQKQLCGNNRDGVLCSDCTNGYAPAINLYQMKCVKCTSIARGIVLFVLFDLILPFIFIFAIFFFDVPLTSGLLHGPILFGQMITSVITLDGDGVISFRNTPGLNNKAPDIIKAMYFFIYDVFNLNFGMIWQNSCLSKDIYYATIIAIHYVSAFLPMIFVIFVGIIYCQDKQDGCLRKCASKFKNAPNALATFILLSYTKLAVITGFLLTPVSLTSAYDTSSNNSGQVMYLDGNIKYNYSQNVPYLVTAIMIGVPFVIVVPIFLFCFRSNDPENNAGFFNHLIHQFQKEFRDGKDDFDITLEDINRLCSCCKERKNEDGTCGNCWRYEYYCCTSTTLCSYKQKTSRYCKIGIYTSWSLYDFRWMAGVLFMLRILIILPYMTAWNANIQYWQQFSFCLLSGIAIIVIRPYKKNIYKYVDPNIVEALSLFLLAIIIAFSIYQYHCTFDGVPLSKWGYVVQTILVWVPFVWIVLAYIVLLLKRYREKLKMNGLCKWCCSKGNPDGETDHELDRCAEEENNENDLLLLNNQQQEETI